MTIEKDECQVIFFFFENTEKSKINLMNDYLRPK